MKISVVTPVYNEAKSLPRLVEEVTAALTPLGEYEILLVDDGSKDDTYDTLERIAKKDKRLKVLSLRANRGQTAALMAGIDHARGDVVVTIDSDLENDPADIPRLVKKLEESGADIVSGWRKDRWQDHFFTRRLPSAIANRLISRISKLSLHDHGCTLKAYRRGVLEDVALYGDMHRFIAAYLSWRGARVVELPVAHRPRLYGRSNYGIGRTLRVLLDLVVIKFFNTYLNRPIHFFGGLGLVSLALGFLAGAAAIVLRLLNIRHFVETPLPTLSALFIIVGVELVLMGVLAEMLTRIYYETRGKRTYTLKKTLNLP
ncbi:glycosyltransferase family 2 protein [Candidatus Kaiserbacteria bacterium]|nr:glycosyltransferase family 2 protein [Candidatus Kaiserbacteria bacterium]